MGCERLRTDPGRPAPPVARDPRLARGGDRSSLWCDRQQDGGMGQAPLARVVDRAVGAGGVDREAVDTVARIAGVTTKFAIWPVATAPNVASTRPSDAGGV